MEIKQIRTHTYTRKREKKKNQLSFLANYPQGSSFLDPFLSQPMQEITEEKKKKRNISSVKLQLIQSATSLKNVQSKTTKM